MSPNSFSSEIIKLIEEKPEWIKLLPNDSRAFLLESGETFTIYRTLIDLFDLSLNHPEVILAHKNMLKDPLVINLVKNLPDWEKDIVTGHNKADYLPNQLWLLLDWGLRIEDDKRIQYAIEQILAHQDEEYGQFLAFSKGFGKEAKEQPPQWTSVLCDHNLIISVLLLAGLENDTRVIKGLKRMGDLLSETSQGMGWKCVPGLGTKFRGPGRVNDTCPMAIVDALRGYWLLPKEKWPKNLIKAGETLLNCWLKRSIEKPYIFGHGKQFRLPRAPFFWYNIGTVLDAVSHYPELVKTKAFRELVAVSLIEFSPDGKFIPKTIFQYFKNYSFGQKKGPSPWMTLFLSRIYKRAVETDPIMVDLIKKIDAKSLKGSKGGPKKK